MKEFDPTDVTTFSPEQQKSQDWEPLPTLTIITHPDPSRIGEISLLPSLKHRKPIHISRLEPKFRPANQLLGKPLADLYLSRKPLILKPRSNGSLKIDTSECGTRAELPLHENDDITESEMEHGVVIVLAKRIVLLLHLTRIEPSPSRNDHGLVGDSDGIRLLRNEIERVADLATPVLLRGGSGSGKELVAHAIHDAGRRGKPFISVNLGAITSSLAASELFGAEKGSFTGADRAQLGYFRAAQNGTLFLDEVGEAPPQIQVMLLRALESGEISPVGSQRPFRVETRLIAATDADLEAKMAADSFKTPLFHRLAGYEIHLPGLTERLEDFGRLFMHFARQELQEMGDTRYLQPRGPKEEPWLPCDLFVRLLSFSWPGNVRQLRNAVRQLLIGCRGESTLHSIPKLEQMLAMDVDSDTSDAASSKDKDIGDTANRRKPADIDSDEVRSAMKNNRWDIKAAAADLNISRAALYLLIERIPDLRTAADLDEDEIRAGLAKHDGDVVAFADAVGVSQRALRRRIHQLNIT